MLGGTMCGYYVWQVAEYIPKMAQLMQLPAEGLQRNTCCIHIESGHAY